MYTAAPNIQAFLSYISIPLKTKYHSYINMGDNNLARLVA